MLSTLQKFMIQVCVSKVVKSSSANSTKLSLLPALSFLDNAWEPLERKFLVTLNSWNTCQSSFLKKSHFLPPRGMVARNQDEENYNSRNLINWLWILPHSKCKIWNTIHNQNLSLSLNFWSEFSWKILNLLFDWQSGKLFSSLPFWPVGSGRSGRKRENPGELQIWFCFLFSQSHQLKRNKDFVDLKYKWIPDFRVVSSGALYS